jgi:hypothetical protein
LAHNTLIVISSPRLYFNPFSFGPGNSLKIAYGDQSINTVVEKPHEELIKAFCSADGPRRFIAFEGASAKDLTEEVKRSCSP